LAAPTISQYAALEALHSGQEETEKMKLAYDERRRYLIKALKEMSLDCFAPEGAFYVFPCIKKTGLSSDEFIDKLFQEEKLLFISGTAFGPMGEGYVRISYAYSLEKIKEGMARLSHFLSVHTH
jgi:aminotransferase